MKSFKKGLGLSLLALGLLGASSSVKAEISFDSFDSFKSTFTDSLKSKAQRLVRSETVKKLSKDALGGLTTAFMQLFLMSRQENSGITSQDFIDVTWDVAGAAGLNALNAGAEKLQDYSK